MSNKRENKKDEMWEQFYPIKEQVRKLVNDASDIPDDLRDKYNEMRNAMASRYYGLVTRIAEKVHAKIVAVDVDVLTSLGVDGLYDSIDGFTPSKGNKFETYASWRIRFGIIDEIRKDDWVPRLARQRAKALIATREELEGSLGRKASDEEMAEAMEMDVDEYNSLASKSSIKSLQSLDTAIPGLGHEGAEDLSIIDCISDGKNANPSDSMIDAEFASKLFGTGFTPMEKQVIWGYHYEKRSMKEISKIIGLSESRVSQMHARIMKRLEDKIIRNPTFFGPMIVEFVRNRQKKGKKKERAKR